MALPDTFDCSQGTSVIFGEAGASGVTNTLSFDALADGSGRMSAEVDLGATFKRWYRIEIWIETGTAPTAGNTVDLYIASSYDGTNYPAGVSGSDGAWPADGNEDEWAKQLEYVGSYVATNDGNTVGIQAAWEYRVKGRYLVVVVDNNLGQAIRDEVTATDNGSRVILTPLSDSVND